MSPPDEDRVSLGPVIWSLVPLAAALFAAALALAMAHAEPVPASAPTAQEAAP
ncbi:MAG: hypothetical protein QM698_11090 [Micropepsaceae bacterium]